MSCEVTYQNKYFIFGGRDYDSQVLQLVGCGLVRIGSITFDHRFGACGSSNDAIMLCFNEATDDVKHCRQSASPNGPWSEMRPSGHGHRMTQIATSPGNQITLVVVSKLPQTPFRWLFGRRFHSSLQRQGRDIRVWHWHMVGCRRLPLRQWP